MESDSANLECHNYGSGVTKDEQYEDLFSFQITQLPPLDHFSGYLGYGGGKFHPEVDNADSFLDSFLNDPYFDSLDYVPNYTTPHPEGFSWGQQQLEMDNANNSFVEKNVKTGCKKLSGETISKYFYMPIAEAAREMKVGVTLLKRRCRELGIKRWPCRKLMSLQTLIHNLKEMGKEKGEENVAEALLFLEQEKRLVEKLPDMQLGKRTKRLRQICFKANFKKRRLMGDGNTSPQFAFSTHSS